MAVTCKLAPDHKTIVDFRRNNDVDVRRVCAQFVELCRRIGMLKRDCVAIDGSKFKAVNNRDKNFTKRKIASRRGASGEGKTDWPPRPPEFALLRTAHHLTDEFPHSLGPKPPITLQSHFLRSGHRTEGCSHSEKWLFVTRGS